MFAFDDRGPGMMDGYDRGMMGDGGAWILMLLAFVVVVALIGAVLVYVVRATGSTPPAEGPGPSAPSAPSPLDVLGLRLARGEITPEEYGAVRQLLDR